MDGDQDTAKQYRQRAEQVRALATQMLDRGTTELLLAIAEDYERLAMTRERIAQSDIARASKPNEPPRT